MSVVLIISKKCSSGCVIVECAFLYFDHHFELPLTSTRSYTARFVWLFDNFTFLCTNKFKAALNFRILSNFCKYSHHIGKLPKFLISSFHQLFFPFTFWYSCKMAIENLRIILVSAWSYLQILLRGKTILCGVHTNDSLRLMINFTVIFRTVQQFQIPQSG